MKTATLIAFSAWAIACSSESIQSNDASGGTGGNAGSSNISGMGSGGKAKCDAGPGYSMPSDPQQVAEVSATLLDVEGLPVEGEVFEVCGTDVCSPPAVTGTTGKVVINPSTPLLETKPAAKFGEGKLTPRIATLLPRESVIALGSVVTVRLPPMNTGAPLTPGISASSGGLSLLPSAGGLIKFDTLTFETDAELALRAVLVPLDRAPAFGNDALGLEIVYGATPTETRFCPPAKLSIDNSQGWDADSDVEVFLHGVDISEEFAPYGGWAKVSDARVSADGTSIETTTPGIPVLGVLGLRRR